MNGIGRMSGKTCLAKIQNDCTNQSITDKQIQVRIKRGRFCFGGGGLNTNCEVRKAIKGSYKVKDRWIFSLPSRLKTNDNSLSNL